MTTTWREQLAWAAGFYDGEGCCSYTSGGGAYRLSIAQVDPEVLEKFRSAVLNIGVVRGPRWTQSMGNSKPRYDYEATGANAQAVIAMLWPWLGTVKKAQAAERLRGAAFRVRYSSPQDDHRVCPRGHPYAGNRTKYSQCRPCMKLSEEKRKARTANERATRSAQLAADRASGALPYKKRGRPPNSPRA